MKQLALTLCLALACGTVDAQKVFRIVQPDGTVEFTDVPPSSGNAQQIEIPPLNTAAPLAPPPSSTPPSTAAAAEGYSEFRITSPADGETIRSNAGSVKIDLSINPSLRDGDKIALNLDGQDVGGGRSTAITLTEMERGAHSVQALIKSSAGRVIKRSNSITFDIQRRSAILQPSAPRAVPFGGGSAR